MSRRNRVGYVFPPTEHQARRGALLAWDQPYAWLWVDLYSNFSAVRRWARHLVNKRGPRKRAKAMKRYERWERAAGGGSQ